ncbi:hypothetical protein CDL12_14706 [Handroanthus impetiginosus]|uniref:Uncharacterized protein n=1 Tax=Handroanthus impetiginosus TaxID=429701 RepID=A0A2G9H585_9LAMI|nr:hypothetical protein CDL12_14706 [Handroanthus impetiginosus]
MDDLHSIASISRCRSSNMDMSSRSCISNSFSQGWLSNWNDNHIGVFNAAEDNMSQYMDMMMSSRAAVAFVDDGADHFSRSTGYLQDVLFDFTSKRRRLMLYIYIYISDLQTRDQNYCWTSNLIKNCCEELDSTLSQFTKPNDIISGTYKLITFSSKYAVLF